MKHMPSAVRDPTWDTCVIGPSSNVSPSTSTSFSAEGKKASQGLMPANIPGILVPFHLLINPRLVIPALSVRGVCDVPDWWLAGRIRQCWLLMGASDLFFA